jgi:WD40 repeat protein
MIQMPNSEVPLLSGSVRCLAWDDERNLLFSGSFDQSIIVWDIGGQRGTAFELQGHKDKVQTLFYCASSKQLLSTGDEGILAVWDMTANRQEVGLHSFQRLWYRLSSSRLRNGRRVIHV